MSVRTNAPFGQVPRTEQTPPSDRTSLTLLKIFSVSPTSSRGRLSEGAFVIGASVGVRGLCSGGGVLVRREAFVSPSAA